MSGEGRAEASCRLGDAVSIFKILTSPSILLMNWQLFIKHSVSFPFQYFGEGLQGEKGEMFGGSACFGFLGGQSRQASH